MFVCKYFVRDKDTINLILSYAKLFIVLSPL